MTDWRRGIGRVCSQVTACLSPTWEWKVVRPGVSELWCVARGRYLGRREEEPRGDMGVRRGVGRLTHRSGDVASGDGRDGMSGGDVGAGHVA